MGSTITTGRVAAAVRTRHGPTLFVLFEESYSSNVYPHTPAWCCVGLGYLPAVMERIFGLASDCEGGMLRNRSGRLTPEGYIGTWLKELASPLLMRRTAVRLDVGDGCYAAIPTAKLGKAVELLHEAGRPAQATELCDTKAVTLDLACDTDAVLALQVGLELSPWRLVSTHAVSHCHGERDASLGHASALGRTPVLAVPTALKLNADVRLLRDPDGAWRCGGWQYALVRRHVQDLWRAELACPGHHRKRIATFRNAFKNAPQAPGGLSVEIDATKTTESFYLREIEGLRQHASITGTRDTIFCVPVTGKTASTLADLPRDCARWLIPGESYRVAEKLC